MLRGVGFLPAYRAAGRAALRVVAQLALPGGRLPDPVSPLGGDGPVAGSQLVDVDRGLPVSSGDGRGEARAHKQAVPPGRPGLDGTGARQSGCRPVRGPDVHSCGGLVQGAGLLGD